MFQEARRYLPSAAVLASLKEQALNEQEQLRSAASAFRHRAATTTASLKDRAANTTAVVKDRAAAAAAETRQRLEAAQLRFEVPDTTAWALAGTTFNLLNATTGPGLLALPLAFARCGWVLGSALLLLVFLLNNAALSFLLKSCLATREHSYIGLSLRHSAGLAALVDWSSLAFFFGSCVSYLVIIGDAFGQVTATMGDGPTYRGGLSPSQHYATLALGGLVVFTLACLLPLSLLRSMDSLQVTSAIAMVAILYAVAVVVYAPGVGGAAAAASVMADQVAVDTSAGGGAGGGGPSVERAVLSAESLLSLPTMTFCFASQVS